MAVRPQPHTAPPALAPALALDRAPDRPSAAVLVLHGGRADGLAPPSALSLAGARMRPFSASIARATAGRGIALGRVRYLHRGWNGERADAARDAVRALDELAASCGSVPVVLVGHSMGGRAALSAAAHPAVRGVVALAPWCPEGEPVDHLAGKDVVLVHGDRDRVTDPRDSWSAARRARAAGAATCALRVPGGDHAMLRGAGAWHTLTVRLVTGLLGLGPLPPAVVRSFSGQDGPEPADATTVDRA
ncbi:alpha/beta hydrolase [Streptomyces genisteinicus]|uniref:Alpha/beta hydrolase n=1 Tax=Streptomyces genisteinicus TaxID=2768068 RepID=A0A7H0I3B1_9ACTN|nr:alpha/beta hydrolase [Streptomyces genisteinicus]